MLAMASAFGIPALRTMFTAARLLQAWAPAAFRRPLASRAAAFPLSTTLAVAITLAQAGSMGQPPAALRRPPVSRVAAFPPSMALEAAAGVFAASAAPEDFMAAPVEPSHSVDTEAAAIAELLPGY